MEKSTPDKNNDFMWRQFVKLGDMMGDGLHLEPDGKWITKEYNRLSRILNPEIYQDIRKRKADAVNTRMAELLQSHKCTKCNGELKQSRKGSKVCYCTNCGIRYKASAKPNNSK